MRREKNVNSFRHGRRWLSLENCSTAHTHTHKHTLIHRPYVPQINVGLFGHKIRFTLWDYGERVFAAHMCTSVGLCAEDGDADTIARSSDNRHHTPGILDRMQKQTMGTKKEMHTAQTSSFTMNKRRGL